MDFFANQRILQDAGCEIQYGIIIPGRLGHKDRAVL